MRREGGVTDDGVYQSVDDFNDITAYYEFETIEEAKSFVARDDLRAAMEELGVRGAPQIWINTRL